MITKAAFVAHPTRDLEASKTFFEDALGLTVSADYGDAWLELDTPDGLTIALDTIAPKFSEAPVPYLALETDDIDAEVERLREAGVTIARETWTNRADDGRDICKMALVLDPGGNSIMLHEIAAWRSAE